MIVFCLSIEYCKVLVPGLEFSCFTLCLLIRPKKWLGGVKHKLHFS